MIVTIIAARDYRLNCIENASEFTTKISMYGLTCGRDEKTGTFCPIKREECACNHYHENARFQENLRENKRKIGTLTNPDFGRSVHNRPNIAA